MITACASPTAAPGRFRGDSPDAARAGRPGRGGMAAKWRRWWLGMAGLACLALAGHAEAGQEPWKLFLLIGQSNMSGRGAVEAIDREPHPRVFTLTKELTWRPATDPLHFDRPDRVGVGLGSSFARMLAEQYPAVTIGLIPAAVGATSIEQWQPGGEIYLATVARAREAMKRGTLAGILWHQGENDRDKASDYSALFIRMIEGLRGDLQAENVPVLVGELVHTRESNRAINAVIAELPARVPSSVFVSSEGLKDIGDQTHFDAMATREFGRRYAAAYLHLAGALKERGSP